MTSLQCWKSRCQWKTQEVKEFSDAKWLLETHLLAEHGVSTKKGSGKSGGGPRAEKVRRPEVSPEMSSERWAYFNTRWTSYRDACTLTGAELVLQLKECMDESLREDHHNQISGGEVDNEADLLVQIKSVAVKKANRQVDRDKLGQIRQEKGEPVRKFAGRIRNLALVADFKVKCPCGKDVPYAEERIMDQIISGLNDVQIKTEVLSKEEVPKWGLQDLVSFVESKEAGKMSVSMMGGP